MRHIGLIPSRSAAPSSAGRAARLLRQLAPILPLALAAALGCRDDAPSPTAPDSEPALATTATPAPAFRQVSAGTQHTCGVTSDDRAYCWGRNDFGQLGHGTDQGPEICTDFQDACSTRPLEVLGGLRFRQVSAGEAHTCGITTDYHAYCWGDNIYGQLGDGTLNGHLTPVAVAGTRRFRQVRAGDNYTCAITLDDVAFCWGDNGNGQLGDGTSSDLRLTPVLVRGGLHWRQLSGGSAHTCGVTTEDRAYCWGNGSSGELGNGTQTLRVRPVAVSGGLLFRQIEAGFAHTCGVTTADGGYCWGRNDEGELGDGTTISRLVPTAVAGQRRFDNLNAGGFHTCGVTLAGRGFCWGHGSNGELGNGTQARQKRPVAVSGGLLFQQVSAGFGFSCGATTDDRAYCWGRNDEGQLGDGTTVNRLTPVAVAGPM